MTNQIFINLKRFDIPKDKGGLNALIHPMTYGGDIVKVLNGVNHPMLDKLVVFFPEAHIISAVEKIDSSILEIGAQGVSKNDTGNAGQFGAFTTQRTSNSMKSIGCEWVLIGHSEERRLLKEIIGQDDISSNFKVSTILNQETRTAVTAGLKVLFCIGERDEERMIKAEVFREQLELGLRDIDFSNISIAYEPIWAIGPNKTPPTITQIKEAVDQIKEIVDLPIFYGGGLKLENAADIGSIPSISGGLIGLTRFNENFGFFPEDIQSIVDEFFKKRGKK